VRSWPTILTGQVAYPFPLLSIYLRPRRVVTVHDFRPVFLWGPLVLVAVLLVLWCERAVLVADDLFGLVAGGDQRPTLAR
jgi:hypothetical protein